MGEVNVISAWDIYWVMQLDSIGAVVGISAGVLLAAGALSAICALFNRDMQKIYEDSTYEDGKRKFTAYGASITSCLRIAKKTVPAGLALCVLSAFIPSTKTAAMMAVVPRIANNEAIQREAGDLYGIAKDALRNLAAPKQEPRK